MTRLLLMHPSEKARIGPLRVFLGVGVIAGALLFAAGTEKPDLPWLALLGVVTFLGSGIFLALYRLRTPQSSATASDQSSATKSKIDLLPPETVMHRRRAFRRMLALGCLVYLSSAVLLSLYNAWTPTLLIAGIALLVIGVLLFYLSWIITIRRM